MRENTSVADLPQNNTNSIPLIDLKAQFQGIRDEISAAVQQVLESQEFILGHEVAQLEIEIARLLGCRFAIGCGSGSDALTLSLMALGLNQDDEVITTPFTFGATAGSIARVNARPVFVDIDPGTYNIDGDQVEAAITSRTKALMPVHLFGLPCEMSTMLTIAERHGLALIEDAAQAISAKYDRKPVGTLGTFGCFSFFPSKNLGAAGDGGLVTTDNREMAGRIRLMRVHGSPKKYQYEILGINSRLDALQAAILRVKLAHLAAWTEARRNNADRYRFLFRDFGLTGDIILPVEPEASDHVYNQFVIRVGERDSLRDYLRARGIGAEVYYPSPLHLQPAFAGLGYGPGAFPHAERAAREVLALPIFPELTEAQQYRVVETIAEFYEQLRGQ